MQIRIFLILYCEISYYIDTAEGKLAKMSKDDLEFETIRIALVRAITRINVAEKS